MSRFLGIDHVQIPIPEGGEAQTRQFYGEVLGMQELPKPQEMAGRGGLWMDCGPFQLHFGIEPDFRPSKKGHPALIVADLEFYLARLQQAGCTIDNNIQIPGCKRAFASDPFGNRIEFVQPLA